MDGSLSEEPSLRGCIGSHLQFLGKDRDGEIDQDFGEIWEIL